VLVLESVGQVLMSAVAASISPVAIVFVILLLVSKRGKTTAPAYVLGWFIGTLAIVALAFALADGAGAETEEDVRKGIDVIRLLIGLLFAGLAVQSFRTRPRAGEPEHEPKLFTIVGTLTPIKAFGLGLLISTFANPKNLALEIGAGGSIAESGLSVGGDVIVMVVFALIASLALLVPVLAPMVLGERSEAPLAEARRWLIANNSTILVVLFTIMAARFLGQGLGFTR
jgi:hypothetical protein